MRFDYRRANKRDYAMRRFAPSLDRIDPRKWYTLDNTQVVVTAYNIAKQGGTDREMKAMCMSLAAKALEADVAKLLGR